MAFYEVHFSYDDQETMEETFVSVPEPGGDKLIPGPCENMSGSDRGFKRGTLNVLQLHPDHSSLDFCVGPSMLNLWNHVL